MARRKLVKDIVEGLVVDVYSNISRSCEKAGGDLVVLILWCFVVEDGD